MPDYIGRIAVPEVAPSGTFPLIPDWAFSHAIDPPVAVHVFGSANAKIEQRYLLGTGARRFRASFGALSETRRQALRDFWEARKSAYQPFLIAWPNEDGQGTTEHTVRFENEPLSYDYLADAVSSSAITFVEVKTSAFPEYDLNGTQERFPDAVTLQPALLGQVQEIIPLVYLRVREAAVDDIFLSDRRCTVGGQLYQARLISWDGIAQELGGASDQARFTFGNADRVMRDLANDTDLDRAIIRLSLYHVGTGIRLDLWQGQITAWGLDAGAEFSISASDGLYELNLPYPTRKVSRQCWKVFKGPHCPAPSGESCDKGFDTPNGCQFHGMDNYFGGILAKPYGGQPGDRAQAIARALKIQLTSTSQVSDSIFNEIVPEIYCNVPMKVPCKIAAGREENEFYDALGVVGEGPLTTYGGFLTHSLDNQPPHGPDPLGLRLSLGADPNPNPFSLGQGDPQVYGPERAAGTAFIELRRKDAKGMQLTRLAEHEMFATVAQGLGGWTWSAPGARSWNAPLINPVWIAVNIMLRALGLRTASTSVQEAVFDVGAAIAAAAICDDEVDKIVGEGKETQFTFAGILQEQKPLRDWLAEVLMGCQGYYTWACGKFRVGVRYHSGTAPPEGGGEFTVGNTIFNSLRLTPAAPTFNHLTAHFADSDYEFAANTITLYDVTHAAQIAGTNAQPVFLKSDMNLVGVCGKSQAARLLTTRLREELGGITAAEWKAARHVAFQTTILALAVEPGMVCLMTHPDMPGGAGEFRVTGWRLNGDYSVEILGRSTTDSMYDLTIGPKPADVVPEPPPEEIIDLVPDDVRPIETDAFLVEKSEDGVNVVLSVAYDPPDPIGVFRGVALHIVRPDQQPDHFGDFDYNGDAQGSGTERYGSFSAICPQPEAEQNWDLYLVSRSRVYRKPLNLTESPKRTVTIAARGIGLALPVPDVAASAEAVASKGIKYGFSGTLTFPTGHADYVNLAGIEVTFYGPLDSGGGETTDSGPHTMGVVPAPATTGGDVAVDWCSDYWDRPASEEYFKVRYVKVSIQGDRYDNTPYESALLTVESATEALGVPDVAYFRAGQVQDDGTYLPQMYWDPLRDGWLKKDWAALAPFDRTNWSGAAVWCEFPNGSQSQLTGIHSIAEFVETDTNYYVTTGAIAVEPQFIPPVPEAWKFICVSYDADGQPKRDQDGKVTGKSVTLTTLASGSWDLWPPFVSNLAAMVAEYGWDATTRPERPQARILVTWTAPSDADEFTYYSLWRKVTSTSVTEPPDASGFEKTDWSTSGSQIDPWIDRPPVGEATDRCWFRVITYNKLYSGPPVNICPVCYVDITAPGAPAQVTGFSVVRNDLDTPAPTFSLTLNYTTPTDPEFRFSSLERVFCDSGYNPLPGQQWERQWEVGAFATPGVPTSENHGPWTYPSPSPEYQKIRAMSVSRAGIRNETAPPTVNLYIPAVTTISSGKLDPATLHGSLAIALDKLGVAAKGVTTDRLADLAVTAAQLATGAVIDTKIFDGAVGSTKLASLAVLEAHIANAAVTSAKIGNAAVGSAAIAALAVGNAHIQDLAVTSAKIASLDVGKLTAGTCTATVSFTAPTLVITSGDTTINIDGTNALKISNTYTNITSQLDLSGVLTIKVTSNQQRAVLNTAELALYTSAGNLDGYYGRQILYLQYAGALRALLNCQSNFAVLSLHNSSGAVSIDMDGGSGSITNLGTLYPTGGLSTTTAGLGATGFNCWSGGSWRYGSTQSVAYKKPDDSTGYLWFYGGVFTGIT